MADDIVERLRTVDVWNDAIGLMSDAADEIERLRDIASELSDAFQEVTDQGDDCRLCWDGFKATRVAENCYGHAAILNLEARRG